MTPFYLTYDIGLFDQVHDLRNMTPPTNQRQFNITFRNSTFSITYMVYVILSDSARTCMFSREHDTIQNSTIVLVSCSDISRKLTRHTYVNFQLKLKYDAHVHVFAGTWHHSKFNYRFGVMFRHFHKTDTSDICEFSAEVEIWHWSNISARFERASAWFGEHDNTDKIGLSGNMKTLTKYAHLSTRSCMICNEHDTAEKLATGTWHAGSSGCYRDLGTGTIAMLSVAFEYMYR